MANDPANSALALSGIGAGPPQEAEYHAVYAAVTATERGRWFLTEFASRNRHADTGSLVAALTRIEAAVGGEARTDEPAATQDLAAAAEKISDIAFALRERGGDPALCDALDAAAREIGVVAPAAVAGAARARTAPAHANGDASAGDFEFELQDSEKFAAAAVALGASFGAFGDQTVGDQNSEPQTLNGSAAPPVGGEGSLPDQQASGSVLPPPDYLDVAEPPKKPEPVPDNPRWYIEPPDFLFEQPRPANGAVVASSDGPQRPRSLLPGTQFLPNPEEDPAELFEPAATIAVTPPVSPAPAVETEPVSSALRAPVTNAETPPSRSPASPPVRTVVRPAPVNPLAALHALTEDELLALFG